ncbi:uncharacterized protein LOC135959969 [Calliphora vicina]|uniref:uncharacterized protein LOC135959969 n=2 Tax=Calliphora vicina TaxID=7373 RepID=UPI00325C2DB3
MSNVLCSQCNNIITTTNFVKCHNCNANYHFSTCSPLSESTYTTMTVEKKMNWRCHVCKPRSKSPNNIYQAFVFDENNQQKQIRDDTISEENDRAKKFKESLSLNSVNSKLCSVQSDVTELKSDMKEIKSQIEMLASNVNTSNLQIKDEIQSALSTITQTLSTLVAQVSQLNDKDKQREKQINNMEMRMNKIEQQMIAKNIEIKNIDNKQISPFDVVKKIAASRNVEIKEEDISKAYRLKRQESKIIVEFLSLDKKTEFMSKIERHRVEASIINSNDNNNSKYIYINDQLIYNYRQLLWVAKTKAHEANWKFVWVRNGNIFARKNENSPSIIINNAADIESITSTI